MEAVKPKVLIVDDAKADRVRASGIIARWRECEIIEAANGRAAIDKVGTHFPDVILTDLHMPEMDGLELVAAVREEHPGIPVILMTAKGSEEIAAQALRQGAASYVPKLRMQDDLVPTLNQVYHTSALAHGQSRLMHYMTESSTSFVLRNDRMLIRACVRHLLNLLRCVPLGDETERLRVGIALHEALENAFLRGNLEIKPSEVTSEVPLNQLISERLQIESIALRRIHVHYHVSRSGAEFTIRDDGPGFDVASLWQDDSSGLHNYEGNRGLTLMKSVMDSVEFNDLGNEVRLTKMAVPAATA